MCNKGGKLHVLHIKEYANYEELRTTVSNGVTLCVECHRKFHHNYGLTNLPNIFDI